mgnify:CR=1 FL=1
MFCVVSINHDVGRKTKIPANGIETKRGHKLHRSFPGVEKQKSRQTGLKPSGAGPSTATPIFGVEKQKSQQTGLKLKLAVNTTVVTEL